MSADRSRWIMLTLLVASRTSLGVEFQTVGSVAKPLMDELGLGYAEVGTLIGLFMLPGIALSMPAGWATRWASDRLLVGLGLFAMALGAAVAGTASGFAGLAIGRLACGVGFVFCSIYYTKMVVDWFAGRELATAMSLLVMSWPLGIAIGQVGHEGLASAAGWRMPFAAAAMLSLVAAVAVLGLYRAPVGASLPAAGAARRLPRRELVLTLIASIVWAAFNAGYIVFVSFAPRLLAAAGDSQAGAVVSVASWVLIGSGAVCGQVADRSGKPDTVLYVCLSVAIASLLLLRLPGFGLAACLAFGLVGVSPAGVIMALTGRAMAPERRAFGMGVFSTAYYLMTAPAPAIAGWIVDASGSAVGAIAFAAAMFGIAMASNWVFGIVDQRLR